MECLVAFVVLFVLPLAVAGVLLGWRAARVAKRVDGEARAELGRLRERLAALEGGGEVARTAFGAGRAADSVPDSSVASRGGVAGTASFPSPPDSGYAPAPAAEIPPSPPLPPPLPLDAGRPAVWPAAAAASAPMPAPPAAPRVSLEERLGARLPVWVGA